MIMVVLSNNAVLGLFVWKFNQFIENFPLNLGQETRFPSAKYLRMPGEYYAFTW